MGDLVNAGSVGGPRPAIITNIQGKDITIRYTAKARGLALVKQAELTPNKDFDWCGGIALDSLQEGSAVEGRYLHGEGGKKWFRGKIAAINSNGTFAISYNDGDYEASVWRENIRTKADRDRPNPQLAQLKGKSMNQSFASSLSPAHRDSESPKQTTKPAQAEPAEATGEAEATRKQAKQSKAAETRVAVKEEPVEEYDGSYACLICGESVRGMEALKCSHRQCESNPLHRACITNPKWLHECPSCGRQTMKPWSGAGGRQAAAVATIDLTTGGGKGRSNAQDPRGAASEPMRERGQGGGTGARQKRVARASSAAAMVASGDVTDTGKGGGARGRLEPETRAQKGKRRRPAADVASPGPPVVAAAAAAPAAAKKKTKKSADAKKKKDFVGDVVSDEDRLRKLSKPVKPFNAWFPCHPDDPNKKNPIEDAKTADAALYAWHKMLKQVDLKVEYKRVKWNSEEVFLYEGGKAFINGSPLFFCGKCTGVWWSHDYPPDAENPSRAKFRLLRQSCKFCGATSMQEQVLESTCLG